jgi:small subunit ribosomal protein S16
LKRTGRTNYPSYRIVAADSRAPRGGRIVENLGFYAPRQSDPAKQVALDVERARYWVSVGARASETVASILRKHGVTAATK